MDLWSTQPQPLSWHLISSAFVPDLKIVSIMPHLAILYLVCLYMLVNSHSWLVLCITPIHNFLLKGFLFWRFRSAGLILWWWCSVTQSCPTLCNRLPAHHQLPEITQTPIHWIYDVIQPIHPLLSPPLAFTLSQHQNLFFKWVSSSHQVAKVLELQHQSFQWIFRIDFL